MADAEISITADLSAFKAEVEKIKSQLEAQAETIKKAGSEQLKVLAGIHLKSQPGNLPPPVYVDDLPFSKNSYLPEKIPKPDFHGHSYEYDLYVDQTAFHRDYTSQPDYLHRGPVRTETLFEPDMGRPHPAVGPDVNLGPAREKIRKIGKHQPFTSDFKFKLDDYAPASGSYGLPQVLPHVLPKEELLKTLTGSFTA